jgi:CBS domain containing-hemolysin-like protein
MTVFFQIILILTAIFFAGLCAGFETGMYQLNMLRLRLGVEKKKFPFIILGKIMEDSHSLLITTLLGTNLAHYIATSLVTYLFLEKLHSEHRAELFATFVTAPFFFVFTEVIPKNLFFYRADYLMSRVSLVMFILNKAFTYIGIVPLLKSLMKLSARFGIPPRVSMEHIGAARTSYVRAIIEDTEGLLSPVQAGIINRMAHLGHLTIESVMTPLSRVEAVDINSSRSELISRLEHCPFTRLPVYEKARENIVGFINIYQCLTTEQNFSNLREFVRSIETLPAETIVTEAINIIKKKNQKMVLVVKEGYAKKAKPVGVVTMKDLAEEILGEVTEW